jgi:hypothetical protein
MAYSDVSHPRPVFLRNAGALSSIVAVQMIFVWPISIKTDPSGYFKKSLVMRISRISFQGRPSALTIHSLLKVP